MIASGRFPKPVPLSSQKKVFLLADLDAWFRAHREMDFPLDPVDAAAGAAA
jgi:predicted DNA-binding transcriptional regulator AlpA